jgi:hypothetical protein
VAPSSGDRLARRPARARNIFLIVSPDGGGALEDWNRDDDGSDGQPKLDFIQTGMSQAA